MNNGEQFFNTTAGGGGGYEIERSVRFNSSDSAYLSRTPASAGNRKTWTYSIWLKKSNIIESGSRAGLLAVGPQSPGSFCLAFSNNASGNADGIIFDRSGVASSISTARFRDVSAWYHIVVSVNTTLASNRVKVYANGKDLTDWTSSLDTIWGQNVDTEVNSTSQHRIGQFYQNSEYFNGYLADIFLIDGQALDPTSFGEFDDNGIWQPIEYTGTATGNSFHLPFSDNSTAAALGTDTSGNSNTWTVNNISVAAGADNDSLVDSPTNGTQSDTGVGGEVVGNYCTWNAVDNGGVTLSNGNLDTVTATTWKAVRGTIGISSGKWYWEYTMNAAGYTMLGMTGAAAALNTYAGVSSTGYAFYSVGGGSSKWNNNASASYGDSFTTNDVIGVAFDADNGKIWFSKNGTWQASGDPAAGTNAAYSSIPSGTYFPTVSQDNSAGATGGSTNFGQRPFAYTAPSGFKALCTTNLPTPTILKGSDYFDTKLYTGNGSTQTISGLGFSPDFAWLKSRSQAVGHFLFDTIRGAGKFVSSDSTNAEADFISTLSSFNSDGFSLGSNAGVNNSSSTYTAWCWDAGSSTVSNTQGSITSTVRANPSAGFSVVTWTAPASGSGWTVGHGLGAGPFLMIDKCRSNTGNWTVYHQSLGATKALYLNGTDAQQTSSIYWNNTAPTSQVFTCGTTGWYGASFTHVTYCFAPVAGYSSFGSYTGNGSADGPFVYCGFRPKYVLIKRTDTTNYWIIQDGVRNAYNVVNLKLAANTANAENDLATIGDTSQNTLDFLSNGFKCRTSNAGTNTSGGNYVYACFAENPFSIARAR